LPDSSFSSSHDFIVIGAGSAGSIVASRLSESGKFSVLVLEAGGWDRHLWIHVPIGFAKTIIDKAVNWAYHTEPQTELKGRRIYWPRGKVIGGSGAINGLIHIRGQREDFDGWRDAGCPGWGWSDVLPYFRRVEDHYLGDTPLHGKGGPVSVFKPRDKSVLCESLIAAGINYGLARNEDFNGDRQDGIGYYDLTVKRGLRSNSAIGALNRAKKRPNLRIEVGAHAERVVFEGTRAVGVEYRNRRGETVRVGAKREVVACGGAVNSPQLLMLSGIGPAEHLASNGIALVAASEQVGQNLQDHITARLVCKTKDPITLNDEMRTWWGKLRIGARFVLFRRGPLTYAAAQAGMFFKSREDVPQVDAQSFLSPYSAGGLGQPLHPFSAFGISVAQSWPTSRGSITLRDADPRSPPVIQPNYLSTEEDRSFFVNAMRKLREVMHTKPLDSVISEEYSPGPAVRTDAEMLDFVRSTVSTCFHPCGTCRMGNDEAAVVDPALRVRGVAGLRVADASVMPRIISGNINAPCLMIGEKAADLILADHPQ
jgi:choline dehydrogenase